MSLSSYLVIPARLESSRLRRKLLLCETGKPLIQHTYEAARQARRPQGVCVAADHDSILHAVHDFGGQACLTDPTAASGTDRVAEAARQLPPVDIIVNMQGDEPELSGLSIDRAIATLEENPQAVMSTLATPIRSQTQLLDPACVKVVCNAKGNALYFSRSPIPHARDGHGRQLEGVPSPFLQHIGLYAYRSWFLQELAQLPRSPLEEIEKLEQLRVLWSGRQIAVAVVPEVSHGIDTRADYQAFVERQRRHRMTPEAA